MFQFVTHMYFKVFNTVAFPTIFKGLTKIVCKMKFAKEVGEMKKYNFSQNLKREFIIHTL